MSQRDTISQNNQPSNFESTLNSIASSTQATEINTADISNSINLSSDKMVSELDTSQADIVAALRAIAAKLVLPEDAGSALTAEDIAALYESVDDVNRFTDAYQTEVSSFDARINDLENSIPTQLSSLTSRLNDIGSGIKFVTADTQYQTQVSTPTANDVQLVTAAELSLHQKTDQEYLTDLANQIANAQFTDEQKQQLASDILSTISETAVSELSLETAINNLKLSIATPESIVMENDNCKLLFSKYSDGRMEVTGQVFGDGSQIIFPTGFSFIDVDTIGCGSTYAGLDDQSNSIMHVGKIQVSANDFLWKASSFGASVLVGAPISDNEMYRINIIGRWK